jgi:proline utilization trans-activator
MPEISTVSPGQDDIVFEDSTLLEESQLRESSADVPLGTNASPANGYNDGSRQDKYSHDTPRLVQDTSGRSHYIGPSGSLSFFAELRELVSERHPSSRFASDNVAEALEARSEPFSSSLHPTADETYQPVALSPNTTSSVGEALRSVSCLRNLPVGTLDRLLRLYFDNVHTDFPLFHRAIFQDEFEHYFLPRSNSRPQFGFGSQTRETNHEPDDGWLVCLHMMVAFGCVLQRTLHGNDGSTTDHSSYEILQSECWNVSRAALPRLTTMCVQSHVQALLLIASYLHSINERNASWTLAGCAARIAVAIGLHRKELHVSFPLIEREIRKRIWCTLYGFEQFLCLSLGRPSAIDDDEVNASAASDDIMGTSNGPPGYAEWNFQLQLLSSKLRRTMSVQYQPATLRGATQKMTPKAMLNELKHWQDNLPTHLMLPGVLLEQEVPSESQLRQYCAQYPVHHLRSIILLHIQYHSLVILATRPCLLMIISASSKSPVAIPYPWDGVTDEANLDTSNGITIIARSCVFSASRLATLILILDRCHILNGLTWLDVFYAYSAAMVLLLRILWIPHPSAARDDLEKEEAMKGQANTLVTEVRQVLKLAPKSSTMQRFASVVENFADVVTASAMANRRLRNQTAMPPRSRAHQRHQERSASRRVRGSLTSSGITGIDTTAYNAGAIDPQIGPSTENVQYLRGNNGDRYSDHYNNTPRAPPSGARNIATADSNAALPPTIDGIVPFEPEPDDALTEAARVISSFSEEALSAGSSLLWNDPLQSITQHIVDWNEFERFLGGLGEG